MSVSRLISMIARSQPLTVAGPVLLLSLVVAGPGVGDARAGDLMVDVGRGPVPVVVPDGYDPGSPAPLIVMLHGYGGTGAGQEAYVGFRPLADEYGFIYTYPDGTIDDGGNRFWNATDACCDLFGDGVDDAGYLFDLIDEIRSLLSVDPDRIHVAGLSNGGFMSHRMACDFPDLIASIAPLAGVTFDDPLDCDPASPVHVLQIHGTNDGVIFYGGGAIGGVTYPGAVASTETWAGFDGCVVEAETLPTHLDLDRSIPGAETVVTRYDDGCLTSGSAELWTIEGGAHVPALSDDFGPLVVEFLLSHPKGEVVAVPDGALADASLGIAPNPFSAGVTIALAPEIEGRAEITVLDVTGRRIRTFTVAAAGRSGTVRWDGLDADGRAVPPGAYFVRVTHDGGVVTRRVLRITGR